MHSGSVFFPGKFWNEARDQNHREHEPEQAPVQRNDRKHIQRADDAEK